MLLTAHPGGGGAVGFDPWHRSPILDDIYRFGGQRLNAERWAVVDETFQSTAQEKLARASYHELVGDEIALFCTPSFVNANARKHLFLVRGVYEAGNGTWSISVKGNDLLVSNVGMGRGGPMTKMALVVALDFEPSRIYPVSSTVE
jgi:hypothetical protein